jgi:pterin-4a-carbinolamine dehydratase
MAYMAECVGCNKVHDFEVEADFEDYPICIECQEMWDMWGQYPNMNEPKSKLFDSAFSYLNTIETRPLIIMLGLEVWKKLLTMKHDFFTDLSVSEEDKRDVLMEALIELAPLTVLEAWCDLGDYFFKQGRDGFNNGRFEYNGKPFFTEKAYIIKNKDNFKGYNAESFTPPSSAVANAKKGLEMRKKWGRGGLTPAEAKSQGIDSGLTRARKIASGKVSRHDVKRMSAFNRHRKNYRPSKKKPDGGPTAGTIAWLLWGGTSGVNWAKKKSKTLAAEGEEESIYDILKSFNIEKNVELGLTHEKWIGLLNTLEDMMPMPILEGHDENIYDILKTFAVVKNVEMGMTQQQWIEMIDMFEKSLSTPYEDDDEDYDPDDEPIEMNCPHCGLFHVFSHNHWSAVICIKSRGGCGKEIKNPKLFSDSFIEDYQAESDTATLKKYEKTYGKKGAKVRLDLKNKIMKQNTHGTKSGQWSARKSQKLKKDYEKGMEKKGLKPYKSSKKTESQKDLKEWGDQDWTTKSGKKSSVTGERYLPSKAIDALTDKEYKKTSAAKKKAKKAGKQFSKQPKDIAKKVAKYRAEEELPFGVCVIHYKTTSTVYYKRKPFRRFKGNRHKQQAVSYAEYMANKIKDNPNRFNYRAEYNAEQEIQDYSIDQLMKSSAVEGDFTQDSLKYSVVENLQAEDSKKKDNPPNGWKIINFYDEKNTNYQLQRVVKCKSFEEVKSLIKMINQIADELNHHPLVKYQFNSVVINLWTHDTNSLTDLDFKFANQINDFLNATSRMEGDSFDGEQYPLDIQFNQLQNYVGRPIPWKVDYGDGFGDDIFIGVKVVKGGIDDYDGWVLVDESGDRYMGLDTAMAWSQAGFD